MMKRYRVTLSAVIGSIVAVLTAGTLAWAAGSWSNLPIAGGASFCPGSTVAGVPGTASTCTGGTVPAGPLLTGNEHFPADTGLQTPATMVVTTCQIAGGSYTVLSPTLASLNAIQVANTTCYYVIDGTGPIGTVRLTMPAPPLDGQQLRISSTVAITTLVMAASGSGTLKGGATSASANTAIGTWIYSAANTTWYRMS